VVRQPVFNGYEELLGNRVRAGGDGSGATGGYLAGMPQGADADLVLAEELHALAPRGLVLLSVSRSELLERRALGLPHERVVLCLAATGRLDDDLRDAIDRHTMRGFRLALDVVDLAAVDRPLLNRAHIVIIEVGARSSHQLAAVVAAVRERASPQKLLAGGVESRASLQTCRRVGFDFFQGQFFLRPTAAPSRTVAKAGLGGIGTMAELATTDSFEGLAAIITRDPGLSMRLLRYANSAHMALPRRVGSVHEALAWLGTVTVREFALIAAVANVPRASREMLATALTRARMCQQLSRMLPAKNPEESFTVGLFSVAEAVANSPIAVVVGELPLREDIALALIHGLGDLGQLLTAVIAYERGDFASAATLTGGSGLIAQTYLESVRWADSAVQAVG
jgi:EAL and modified HD-GYP domain-containing signal transduction protein